MASSALTNLQSPKRGIPTEPKGPLKRPIIIQTSYLSQELIKHETMNDYMIDPIDTGARGYRLQVSANQAWSGQRKGGKEIGRGSGDSKWGKISIEAKKLSWAGKIRSSLLEREWDCFHRR